MTMTDPVQELSGLFRKWSNSDAESIVPLPESGSYRRYYRITAGNQQVMGVHNRDNRENQAFIYLNRQLLKTGNRVPEVFTEDLKKHIYLEQDLGDTTLLDYLAEIRKGPGVDENIRQVYQRVIDAMPGLQVRSTEGIDYTVCYPRAEFDVQSMMWDMNYFKYCLLKPLRIDFFEQDLEDDFVKIVQWLDGAERNSFMFRDFQSRNIMLHQKELFFIDFQGGRKGPLQYDLASLLFEAKTRLPEETRLALLEYYCTVYSRNFRWFSRDEFLEYYYGFVYLRLMQAMGAYGFRGYIERKPVFLQSLPYAVKTLAWLLENKPLPLHLSSLPGVFERLIGLQKIQEYVIQHDTFTVTINSFSYKNGIPQDNSGNGGGFVFDCRALNNPGKYDAYKSLTGKDQPVIEFLERSADVMDFFLHTLQLIDQAVEVYLKRGFTSLMVSYGCTGGQHRSVYMAERLSAYLKNKHAIQIVVRHHELAKAHPA
jgi:aminoglycoside/choline kinase family phosphotransferase